MHIAIIGAGFSGLALAYHLLRLGCQVTLFDPMGVGGGASGIATGLLHPYAGEQGRRSWRAEEGLREASCLLEIASTTLQKPVANYGGILRFALSEEQRNNFANHCDKYGDVKEGEEAFLITSGITVFSSLYLEGLWMACQALGAVLQKIEAGSLEDFFSFDAIVIAGGAGSLKFCPELPISIIKGQVLIFRWPEELMPLERSMIGKGYVARGADASYCQVGSTYERGFLDARPCPEKALGELTPKISSFFPLFSKLSLVDCKAGLRVTRKGHYLPLAGRMNAKTWVMTAMGSRGLLYHGYVAKLLSRAMVKGELLPKELHCNAFQEQHSLVK